MPKRVLIDAGPIVAYLDRSEAAHEWAAGQFDRFGAFLTCESVLAETCARLCYGGLDQWRVLELVQNGVLDLDFDIKRSANRVSRLMQKYADQPMDLADACLVVMSEKYDDSVVLTLDKNDFAAYRRFGRDLVPFIAPGHD
ncbi:MAG TPA: PIN domain-containing protein [Verrucomicrobiae bacterium]